MKSCDLIEFYITENAIQESLNRPYFYHLSSEYGEIGYNFTTSDGTQYEVYFVPYLANEYECHFDVYDDNEDGYDIGSQFARTGKDDSLRVFATVRDIVVEFINKENARIRIFSRDSKLDRLFKKLMPRQLEKYNLSVFVDKHKDVIIQKRDVKNG